VRRLVADLNSTYRKEPALWEADVDPQGFEWIDANAADDNVLTFARIAPSTGRKLVCVCNLSPVVRADYRVGLPGAGQYREVLNTDAAIYGGSNVGNAGAINAEAISHHGRSHSALLRLPPLATVWFAAG